jgi:hypothetical protein
MPTRLETSRACVQLADEMGGMVSAKHAMIVINDLERQLKNAVEFTRWLQVERGLIGEDVDLPALLAQFLRDH